MIPSFFFSLSHILGISRLYDYSVAFAFSD